MLKHLPLELHHEISSYLNQHDIGSLRLVAKALSRINISCMLHTFPFSLSYQSFARALVLTQHPGLSKFVRVLAISTWCENPSIIVPFTVL